MHKGVAQFLAVCRSSIRAETLGYAVSFSSPWRGKRRVVEWRKPVLMINDNPLSMLIHLSLSRLNVKCRQNLEIRYYGAHVVTSCFLECQKPGELKSR